MSWLCRLKTYSGSLSAVFTRKRTHTGAHTQQKLSPSPVRTWRCYKRTICSDLTSLHMIWVALLKACWSVSVDVGEDAERGKVSEVFQRLEHFWHAGAFRSSCFLVMLDVVCAVTTNLSAFRLRRGWKTATSDCSVGTLVSLSSVMLCSPGVWSGDFCTEVVDS